MLLEGVIVHSKLEMDAPGILSFEVMKEDTIVSIHIPAGDSREVMMEQAKLLEIGEKVDLYVFIRDWDYLDRNRERQTGSIYYVRGIDHYP